MFGNRRIACVVLAAGLLLSGGCSAARGGRVELEVSGTEETSGAGEERPGEGQGTGEAGADSEHGGMKSREDTGTGNGNGPEGGAAAGNGSAAGTGQEAGAADGNGAAAGNGTGAGVAAGDRAEPSSARKTQTARDMRERFGEHCIGEQTFEVELSQYDGTVWFVPFEPGDGNPDFHMQLIQDGQDGKVLAELNPYIPEELKGKSFTSLDAVSFYDINFDGNTDILLIETYGTTAFAAVYYGFDRDGEDYERYFAVQEQLSRQISGKAEEVTVSGVRKFLEDTRKNGTFGTYREAYKAVGRLLESGRGEEEIRYGLIDVDGDEIPELAAGVDGYYTSLYTFSGGKVYTLIDRWFYGAMGNAGYEYAPGKNNLRNYNSDYAGAVLYTTYMKINEKHCLETAAEIKTVNFDDANGNGVPDEEEMESLGRYGVSYLNGREASPEECAGFDAGEYQMIRGTVRLEDLGL